MKKLLSIALFVLFTVTVTAKPIIFVGDTANVYYNLLLANGIETVAVDDVAAAIRLVGRGQGVIITAPAYPTERVAVTAADYKAFAVKRARVFIEYPSYVPKHTAVGCLTGKLERGVVSSQFFGKSLPAMSILGLNGVELIEFEASRPLISYAKVAGFDTAQFGLTGTAAYPLLFVEDNVMVASTALSNFFQSRFGPTESWRIVLERITSWVAADKHLKLNIMPRDPQTSYAQDEQLPAEARIESVRRGADWLWNGRLLIHPTWAKEYIWQYQPKDGNPNHYFGPPVAADKLVGDGSFGVMEGHASEIYRSGDQKYRYFIRADVQGESAMMLAAAAELTGNDKYASTAENLLDYLFYTSEFRGQTRNDVDSPSYGLLGWANTHLWAFFNDDNARCILGAIGASSMMDNQRWNKFIVENIFANLRTCSRQGFQGGSLNEQDIVANGWQYYDSRDFINPHPHFESWMWACYLWLYDKCGYEPLLAKTKEGIRITMESYPDKWHVQNGLQQERARMVLPLAWLVRVEDTAEHRAWLDRIVAELLSCQEPCGAFREQLGRSDQDKNKILVTSNDAYGKNEAPLIARNTDKVADMLYTCNFLFFALNEAAYATGNVQYAEAVKKLADFLVKIQIRSDRHKDIDGAWFRAFDYGRWDYWASNADDGWGAWATLTGWIQSWIVSTEAFVDRNTSYWQQTENMDMRQAVDDSLWMLQN